LVATGGQEGWAGRAEFGFSVLPIGVSYKVSIDEWGSQLKNKSKNVSHCNIPYTFMLSLRAYN